MWIMITTGLESPETNAALQEFAEYRPEVVYVCPKHIREQIVGNAADRSSDTLVGARVRDLIRECVALDQNISVNGTEFSIEGCLSLAELALENGAESAQVLAFLPPLAGTTNQPVKIYRLTPITSGVNWTLEGITGSSARELLV